MFSPGTKRHNLGNRNDRNGQTVRGSPITPLSEIRQPVFDNSVPNRPSSGTPAPWTPRLSVLARISPGNRSDKRDEIDPLKPVYVGEFPQIVRDEQARLLQKFAPGDTCISGGLDRDTSLAWIICANKLFIWNYLLPIGSNKCVVLEIPPEKFDNEEIGGNNSDSWLLSVVNWNSKSGRLVKSQSPVGIVLCRKKTRVVLFWFDVFSDKSSAPLTYCASSDLSDSTSDSESNPRLTLTLNRDRTFNSLIATAISNSQNACIAFASSSNGELWQFHCSPTGIHCTKEFSDILNQSRQEGDNNNLHIGYPRSLIWGFSGDSTKEVDSQFLLLTDHEIQCFNVRLSSDIQVSKLWSYEIIGTDSDLGIKKDLAGQKRIWPLYMQADENERVITILVATFCKDRVSNSSYIQYSFLIFQYKSKRNLEPSSGRVLEKKAPLQVIIPKARLEEEEFLFSLRLRVGGKPLGSTIILSGDGKATVSYYFRNSTRLYEFDLPFDAGKVVDASVFSSSGQGEEGGAWVVMTEKAGIWTIPEKAVVLGGVEPPERSLSRKGSSNDRSSLEEKKDLSFAGNNAFGNASTESRGFGERLKGSVAGNAHRAARDEESEALLRQLFHDFLVSGKVDASITKLWSSEAFDRDEETNVFTRISKSIVDTLAKHWTIMRGDEIVAMTIVLNQLIDKRQKHQKFLQFLALSKCHEELCSRQRHSLQIILEHGEKLAAMIELRELQNKISQNRSAVLGSLATASEDQASGALWDVVQLVGDRARRNTVLLMDRDNAEVFYSKISDLDEVFYCLDRQLDYVLNMGQPFGIQKPRACELSNICVSIINTAMYYRSEHQLWYPPPEGLTPWYSQPMVRNGMWNIASFMLQLLNEAPDLDVSAISDLYSHLKSLAEVLLEAYTGAITAKAERGEEHKALLDEYWKRRDTLLNSLYRQIKCFANCGRKGMDEEIIELNEEVLRKHASEVLPIAKRHECYSILWNICCDLNDLVLLKNLMHESMGPKGGFSYYVFEQLHKKRDFSKLLRLGEEFHEELSIYLKQHPDLLWLHELFLHQFSSASDTLHKLALWKDEKLVFPGDEGAEPEDAHLELRLADKKRFLYLSKIAALAGNQADSESKLARIDADLKILKLQEEIVDLCHDIEIKQNADKELLSPQLLVNLCLNAQDSGLLLKAFDVFAWTSTSFREKHRKLLESCWKRAANQDNWNELYQTLVAEGWSDDKTLQALRKTAIFMASIKCYGPHAEIFGDGFEEVLPLRRGNLTSSVYPGVSVEEILMQHKDFPEAGKLMLTAIELGGLEAHNVVENESIFNGIM